MVGVVHRVDVAATRAPHGRRASRLWTIDQGAPIASTQNETKWRPGRRDIGWG